MKTSRSMIAHNSFTKTATEVDPNPTRPQPASPEAGLVRNLIGECHVKMRHIHELGGDLATALEPVLTPSAGTDESADDGARMISEVPASLTSLLRELQRCESALANLIQRIQV